MFELCHFFKGFSAIFKIILSHFMVMSHKYIPSFLCIHLDYNMCIYFSKVLPVTSFLLSVSKSHNYLLSPKLSAGQYLSISICNCTLEFAQPVKCFWSWSKGS